MVSRPVLLYPPDHVYFPLVCSRWRYPPPPPFPFLFVQPPKDPTFLVKHTGTIGPEELLEEMKADPADVESEYLEMAS